MQGLSTFLVALAAMLAAMLAGHLALSRTQGRGLALAFVLAFALQSGLLLVQLLRPGLLPDGLRAATGSALPVLLYLFFARSRLGAGPWRARDAAHLLPPLTLVALVLRPGAGWWLDATLLLIELGYGLAILSSDRREPGSALRRRARHAAAGFLLAMAACDLWLAWEIGRGGALGQTSGTALALILLLTAIGTLFVVAWRDPEWWAQWHDSAREAMAAPAPPLGTSAPAPLGSIGQDRLDGQDRPEDPEADEDARQLCAQLDVLFRTQRRHAEFGVDLDSVARQLAVAPRQLSAAVNRIHGRGFRTLLNDYRVDDAACQLRDPALAGKPITEVMFDAGFQTKSSFNKEFVARLALPPSRYRQQPVGTPLNGAEAPPATCRSASTL